jgi:mono/diheme cytochrome c family protein
MLGNLITLLVLTAIVLACGWLAWRAWHARRALVRWPGVALAGLGALLAGLVAGLGWVGFYQLYLPRRLPVADVQVAGTAEQVARGEHLAYVLCAQCHSTDYELPMSGGWDLSEYTGMPLGAVRSANLTPAGRLSGWSDGDLLRVLREGRYPNGRPLLIMRTGSKFYRHLSDEDAAALIAYLRSQPAVNNDIPPEQPSLLALVFVAIGVFGGPPNEPAAGPVVAPPKAATAGYGEYVVNVNACRDCHGPNLDGGPGGIIPAGPNLRAIVPQWTAEQFVTTLRTGVDPSGHQLSSEMPWRFMGRMDDVELAAMHAYLSSLASLEAE